MIGNFFIINFHNFLSYFFRWLTLKGHKTSTKIIQNYSQWPNIRWIAVNLMFCEKLRSLISWCTTNRSIKLFFIGKLYRLTEITKFCISLSIYQNICNFQISMNHLFRMHIVDSKTYFKKYFCYFPFFKLFFFVFIN